MIQDQTPHLPYDLQDEGSSLHLSTRPPRAWCSMIFLFVWLGGWALGEYFALSGLIREIVPLLTGETSFDQIQWFPTIFLVFWLTIWTFGGVTALWNVIWPLLGREITTISNEEICIQKAVFGIGPKKHYDGAWVENLHSSRTIPPNRGRSMPFTAFKLWTQANLVFEYNGKFINFGVGLETDHAKKIETAIYSRFPKYRPAPTSSENVLSGL